MAQLGDMLKKDQAPDPSQLKRPSTQHPQAQASAAYGSWAPTSDQQQPSPSSTSARERDRTGGAAFLDFDTALDSKGVDMNAFMEVHTHFALL